MQKKRVSRLALKLVFAFLLLGVLLCISTSFVGYRRFKQSIERQYNMTAYQVAAVAASYLNPATLEQYCDIAKAISFGDDRDTTEYIQSPEYQSVRRRFEALRVGMEANDIFLVYVNRDILRSYNSNLLKWYPLTYLFDCYTEEDKSYYLGDKGGINPQYIDEALNIVTTGKPSDSLFISKGIYGYNTSALLPISVKDDILILGVEIPMQTIQKVLEEYIYSAVLVTVGIILVVLILFMLYLFKRVIHPIHRITEEVDRFAEQEKTVSLCLERIKTRDEIENLAHRILNMQKDIRQYIYNLTNVTAEKERISAELSIARHIQLSMLPRFFPAFSEREEFEIYASMTPAKEVGGDFYDFFMIDDTHLAIVIADVSGKGVPAALFMVIGKTLLKDHTLVWQDLSEVFKRVNNLLCESNSEGLFITVFEGILDLTTGEFLYVNAGHEMPFIARASDVFKPYPIAPDFVLAGMENTEYTLGKICLEEGDRLFQYTDGITEATSVSNELYGMRRLESALNHVREASPPVLLRYIHSDIDAFAGETPQFDDITMLYLEFKKKKR